MSVFLDADCALDGLVRAEFFERRDDWKKSNTVRYREKFWFSNDRNTVIFDILVKDGVHKISRRYIKIIENLRHVDLSIIVKRCSIDE
jgi:hypothetical protein